MTPTAAPTQERPAARPAPPPQPATPTEAARPGSMAARLATTLPTAADAQLPADVPKVVVDLVGGAPFAAPEPVTEYLAAKGGKPAPVRVRLPDVAAGTLDVRQTRKGPETAGGWQGIPLLLPVLAPLRGAGIEPVLAIRIRDGTVEGHASIATKRLRPGSTEKLVETMEKHADLLGWVGLESLNLSGVTNTLDGPTLRVGVKNVRFRVARFLDAQGSLELANGSVVFDATATGKVAGLGSIVVPIRRMPDGTLAGEVTVAVTLKGFTGEVVAAFKGGLVDVRGTVGYANEKFDGRVTIIATDATSAKEIVAGQIPGQPPPAPAAGAEAAASPTPAAEPTAGPKPGPRVVAGWGRVNAHLAEWLNGEALVVIDPKGHVTVVGKITPVMKKPLFPQKNYSKELFSPPELRASYGLPVIGNIYLFAGATLSAEAKLGPATLTRMEMVGTWSTDPGVLQSFGLTGTLNVSAYAGLKLTLEGGAGVEILDHDVKFGVAVGALAGIKGYVEATPRIGYRELVDPLAGKKGEFFIGGHLEIAAQPFLGLSGELFVELDSPWWSPAPDKRWPWPIGSLEYPLPGQFGIGADVEHVLGSDTWPQIEFGKVDFDTEKFLTDLVDDEVPAKSGAAGDKQGTFQDALPAAPSAEPHPAVPETAVPKTGKAPAGKAKGKAPKPVKKRSPAAEERWRAGMAALAELAKRSQQDPFTEAEVQAAMKSIRRKHKFTRLTYVAAGAVWEIHAAMSPDEPAAKLQRDPADTATAAPKEADVAPAPARPKPAIPIGAEATFDLATTDDERTGRVKEIQDLGGVWFIKHHPSGQRRTTLVSVRAYRPDGTQAWSLATAGLGTVDFAGTTMGDRATKVRAQPLAWTTYMPPHANPSGWDRLADRGRWTRAHVLNGKAGGPGAGWNLITVHESVNKAMSNQFEKDLRTRVRNGEQLWFKGDVDYYGDDESPVVLRGSDFPRRVTIEYGKVGSPTPLRTWPRDIGFPLVQDIAIPRRQG